MLAKIRHPNTVKKTKTIFKRANRLDSQKRIHLKNL